MQVPGCNILNWISYKDKDEEEAAAGADGGGGATGAGGEEAAVFTAGGEKAGAGAGGGSTGAVAEATVSAAKGTGKPTTKGAVSTSSNRIFLARAARVGISNLLSSMK